MGEVSYMQAHACAIHEFSKSLDFSVYPGSQQQSLEADFALVVLDGKSESAREVGTPVLRLHRA